MNKEDPAKNIKNNSDRYIVILYPGSIAGGIASSPVSSEGTSINLPDERMENTDKMKTLQTKAKSLEDVSISKNKMLKRKTKPQPIFPEMVMAAIKYAKKPYGTSFDDIIEYLERNSYVNTKIQKAYVYEVLTESVNNGMLEKISGQYFLEKEGFKRKIFAEERFRIAISGDTKNGSPNFVRKNEMTDELKKGNDDSTSDNTKLERKVPISVPTRDMVVLMLKNSMKYLKKCNGASFDEISEYIEEKYKIDMIGLESFIENILKDCVSRGIFTAEGERFKMKEHERLAKNSKNLYQKVGRETARN